MRPAESATEQTPQTGAGTTPRVRADRLLAGTRELIIEHGADEYRLRLTSKGKLILTK